MRIVSTRRPNRRDSKSMSADGNNRNNASVEGCNWNTKRDARQDKRHKQQFSGEDYNTNASPGATQFRPTNHVGVTRMRTT